MSGIPLIKKLLLKVNATFSTNRIFTIKLFIIRGKSTAVCTKTHKSKILVTIVAKNEELLM